MRLWSADGSGDSEWSLFSRIRAALFGFDVFISYRQADGSAYARALDAALRVADVAIFRDERELVAGDALDTRIRRALARSRILLLVSTAGAMHSGYVAREVRWFASRHGRVVVLDTDGSWSSAAAAFPELGEILYVPDHDRDAPGPSPAAVGRVLATMTFLRRNVLARRALGTLAVALLLLAAAVIWQGRVALRLSEQARLNALAMVASREPDVVRAALLLRELRDGPEPADGVRIAHEVLGRGIPRTVLGMHHAWVSQLSMDPNGHSLVSAADDGTVRISSVDGRGRTTTLRVAGSPRAATRCCGGRRLVAVTRQGQLHEWTWDTWTPVRSVELFDWQKTGELYHLSLDGQGRRASALTWFGMVVVVDLEDPGAPLLRLGSRERPVVAAEWGREGSLVLVYRDGAVVRHAPDATGDPERLAKVASPVVYATFSRDARVMASSTGERIETRDLASGRVAGWSAPGAEGLVLSPDGTLIGAGQNTQRGAGNVWEARDGTHRFAISGFDPRPFSASLHRSLVTSETPWFKREHPQMRLRFAPDGALLVSMSDDVAARLWDTRTGTLARTLPMGNGIATDAVFAPGNSRVAVASSDATIRVWDLTAPLEPLSIRLDTGDIVEDLRIDPSGRYALVRGMWHAWIARLDASAPPQALESGPKIFLPVRGAAAWTPAGPWVLTGDAAAPPGLQLRASTEASPVVFLPGAAHRLMCAAFDPRGRWVATGWDNGAVALIDLRDGSVRDIPFEGEGAVWVVEFDPTGSRLLVASAHQAAGSWKTEAVVHDLASGTSSKAVQLEGAPSAAWIQRDVARLLSADRNRVLLWTLRGGAPTALAWDMDVLKISPVAFAPDGRRVSFSLGSGTRYVYLLDIEKGRSDLLQGHRSTISSLEFSQSGNLLLSASVDQTIRIWDPRTKHEVTSISFDDRVRRAAFTPGAERVVVALDGPELRVASIRWQDLVEHISGAIDHCLGVLDRVMLLGETEAEAAQTYAQCQTRLGRDPTWPPP